MRHAIAGAHLHTYLKTQGDPIRVQINVSCFWKNDPFFIYQDAFFPTEPKNRGAKI